MYQYVAKGDTDKEAVISFMSRVKVHGRKRCFLGNETFEQKLKLFKILTNGRLRETSGNWTNNHDPGRNSMSKRHRAPKRANGLVD